MDLIRKKTNIRKCGISEVRTLFIPGDGHCFYRSVAGFDNEEEAIQAMRNQVHNVISQDFGTFYEALVYHATETKMEGDETTALRVLEQIRGNFWTGGEVIRVLAEDQSIRFEINNSAGSIQIIEPKESKENVITLHLFFTGCHYEPIVSDSVSDRRACTNAKYCKKKKTEEEKELRKLQKRLSKRKERKRKIEAPTENNPEEKKSKSEKLKKN